ncbi:riboflavin synthase [Spelaeicoccus albus]|uniref:Riboflavin synthase n=1 Tax=Spelaeicoccus albus TaxID=1280376 RepID=A0A7Z0D3N6_9MICO|nr:riboflavin synthase [Spelaeicoccus albus]NYI68294.1 riboflavin synthase [Spelaeicoccus albus]
MFTGIVEEVGRVRRIDSQAGDSARMTIECAAVTDDTKHGDSIAVNGVCLTVTDFTPTSFSVDVMKESLDRSSLGSLAEGSGVNLERAVAVGQRLGGHIVQGHVDGVAMLRSRQSAENWDTVTFDVPAELRRYIAEKGSVTVDGVSLTVAHVTADGFDVGLIPTTLSETTLGARDAGDICNLEVDILAKYIESLGARS